MRFPRPSGLYDLRQLAAEIEAAIGSPVTCDIDAEAIIIQEDVSGNEAQVQQAIDSYVYDPNWIPPEEREFREALPKLQQLHDATKDKATWDALTNPQRLEATRQSIQLLLQTIRFIHRRLL